MTQPVSVPRLRRTRPIYQSTLRALPPAPSTATLEVVGASSATPADPPASHVRVGTGTVIGLAPPSSAAPAAEIAAPAIDTAAAPLAFADTLPGTTALPPAQLQAAMTALAALPAGRHATPSKLAVPAWTSARWVAVMGVVLTALAAGIALGHWGF